MKLFCTFLLGFFLSACQAAKRQPVEALPQRLTEPQRMQLQLARMHYDNGDFEMARKEYVRIILNQPTLYMREIASYMVGESYFEERDYPMAARYFRQYVLQFPSGFKRAESEVRLQECDQMLKVAAQAWDTARLRHEEPVKPAAPSFPRTVKPDAKKFRTTWYWIEDERRYMADSALTEILDRENQVLARVPQAFYKRLLIEGTGRLRDGRIVNWAAPKRFMVVPTQGPNAAPFGLGAGNRPLIPFRTVAVDRQLISLDSRLFIQKYRGITLPDGSKHDGCFVAADVGSAIRGDHIDLFAPSYEEALFVMQRVPEHVEIKTLDSRSSQQLCPHEFSVSQYSRTAPN